jgi:hypothetical protein
MRPYHPIFREKVIKEYMQKQEKDILLHFISPYLFIFSYILLCFLLLTGLWTLWREVPIFISGSGVVLSEGPAHTSSNHTMAIVLFLPAKYASQIHVGAYTQLEVGPARQQLTGTITHIETGIISPTEARKRYILKSTVAQAITQPSLVVTIIPTVKSMPHMYAGDLVGAQVQIGSQRMFSLLLGR